MSKDLEIESEERSTTMTEERHLQDVDLSTLSPEEIKERLTWRDAHPAEVTRYEREREAQRRLEMKMADARDGFLLAGGTEADWKCQERHVRDELLGEEARQAAEAAHAESLRQMRRNF